MIVIENRQFKRKSPYKSNLRRRPRFAHTGHCDAKL